jgi:hypothetical protein
MLDCGILRWEEVFPTTDDGDDPSCQSTIAVKNLAPVSPPVSFPSMGVVDMNEYKQLQHHRNDLLQQLQVSLQEIQRLNTQSTMYRLEVEKLREERLRVREALEGRDTFF